MTERRRSQFTSILPHLSILTCCAAMFGCVQLDGDMGALGEEQAWGTAELIHGFGGNTRIALDANGNAIVVWREFGRDFAGWEIWSRRHSPQSGWDKATRVDENVTVSPGSPALAVDRDGHAIVVWDQPFGTRYDIWASYSVPGEGWEAPESIEFNDDGDTFRPQVAMDANGSAVAVWQQSDGTRERIWANRFTRSDGWGTAERIDANTNADGAQNPQVALDANGNAVVVWQQSDGRRENVWANRFTPKRGWDIAERIEVDNAGTAVLPHVTISPAGDAVVVWQQFDGEHYNIMSNRCVRDQGCGEAEPIELGDDGDAEHPRVAVDDTGNAIAVWQQFDGTSFDVWANRFTPSSGWGTAERIEDDDEGEAVRPQIACDPEGNATVVWYYYDGTRDRIWANRYRVGVGWGIAQGIDGHAEGSAARPTVAASTNGDAMAGWNVATVWNDPNHGTWINRLE